MATISAAIPRLIFWLTLCTLLLLSVAGAIASFNFSCLLFLTLPLGVAAGEMLHPVPIPTHRILLSISGWVIGAMAFTIAEYLFLPASGRVGVHLISWLGTTATAFSTAALLIHRRYAIASPREDLWRFVPLVSGLHGMIGPFFETLARGIAIMIFAVPLALLLLGLIGIPGVYWGMGSLEQHIRIKADIAAIQNWAGQRPDAEKISDAEWIPAIRALKPTRVSVENGVATVRFQYGRVHDYSVTFAADVMVRYHEH